LARLLSFLFISFGFFGISLIVLYASFLSTELPSFSQLDGRQVVESTKIFDRTGEVLLYEIHGEEKRTVISFNEISPYMKFAMLASEDANFYNQPAFDWHGIARAFVANIRSGRVVQGGSTITQQLAKNFFLTPERTIARKVKELILAFQLERRYSKDEIFSLYLNQVPFGSNSYGVEAASRTFFNKGASDLTIAESAILASLPKAPTRYSPWGSRVNELMARKEYVLGRMLDLGFVTPDEWSDANVEDVVFVRRPSTIRAYHFSLAVRDYLVERYGEELVSNGGLRVITTLDANLQELAEEVVARGALRNTERYKGYNAALIAEDPKTGQILALVGSRDPFGDPLPDGCVAGVDCRFDPNFNVALQGLRQPGSALKPFAYMTAFQKGYTPETVVFDVPTEFASNNPKCPSLVVFTNFDKECFHPHNFDGRFRGPVSFAEGLSNSMNIVSVKALYLGGFDDVLANLLRLGINTLRERGRYGLSLVLGGGEVYLSELVGAYATLARDGVRHNQTMVLKVEDSSGRVFEEYYDVAERTIDPQYPRLVNEILSDVELRSGLFHSSLPLTVFDGRDVALKTGTTNDYRDAWTIGYTPSLVVGVWAGNNDNTPMVEEGGSILAAVPMWSEFFREAISTHSYEGFTRSSSYAVSSKPMMNGEYVYIPTHNGVSYPQVHSLLQYVDTRDPTGPFPQDPYQSSQYENWENSALSWARNNIFGFSGYNMPLPQGAIKEQVAPIRRDIVISGISPSSGSFVSSPFSVNASINSKNDLRSVTLYFNSKLIATVPVSGKVHKFSWFVFEPLVDQNKIDLRAVDVTGRQAREVVVVYK
jgi:membrane peptidoglycan carboxypeptidase